MGKGIYKPSEKRREASRENIKKAREAALKLPRTPVQIEVSRQNCRKAGLSNKGRPKTQNQVQSGHRVGKLPKTEIQIEHARTMGKTPKTEVQIENSRKNAFKMGQGDSIDCHHRDLQGGVERPDDVIYMTHSKHMSLHNKLRIKNGTHNFLNKNI